MTAKRAHGDYRWHFSDRERVLLGETRNCLVACTTALEANVALVERVVAGYEPSPQEVRDIRRATEVFTRELTETARSIEHLLA